LTPAKVAVCVVNWFGADDTRECLASLSLYCKDADVYLLENGSGQEDLLAEMADSRTKLVVSKENLGFAAGCNLLIREALDDGAEAILLMNNDAQATEGFLNEPLRILEEPGVGFVALKLVLPGGRELDNAGHRHLDSGDVVPEGRGLPPEAYPQNREILSACAAGLLLKAKMLREIGLFGERFFLGYEDVDLTYRASVMGWRGIFCASSVVVHKLGASIDKRRNEAYYRQSQLGNLLAYLQNTPAAVIFMNLPWIILKYAAATLFGLLSGEFWTMRVHWGSLLDALELRRFILEVRLKNMEKRRMSSWRLWLMQNNCIPAYLKLLKAGTPPVIKG